MKKILVVDDEPRIRKLVYDFLVKEGYSVIEASDGSEALQIFRNNGDTNLVILDVMMPEYDGWAVCREIRKKSDVPVIMLTARSDESDELFGFELGINEYIRKPFSPLILVARVNALLRRRYSQDTDKEKVGMLEIDRKGHFISLNSIRMSLSPKEYELLLLLADNPGVALSRERILNTVWDFNYYKGMRTVDTHIKKIRNKLGKYDHYIQTVRNVGYRFEVDQ